MSLAQILPKLKERGLRLEVVYDIGACVGDWTWKTKAVLPEANFVLFEANPAYTERLTTSGLGRVYIGLLSNPGRSSVYFYNGTNTGDSYYKENTADYDNRTGIFLEAITLDELGGISCLPQPDFIKLDTQGSELDILEGASAALSHASLVLTEFPFVEYNKGAPKTQDYLDFFKARDFLPIALTETYILDGILIHGDLLFMKREAFKKYVGPLGRIHI